MITVTINGRKMQVAEDSTVLTAAEKAGIEIPTLCHHPALAPYGACRVCLVEIVSGGKPGLAASCQYRVRDGLVVQTDTEMVAKTRRIMLELLLARNPDSERIRELAGKYGVTESRITKPETDDCILCGLCVRICGERIGQSVLSFVSRGVDRRVGSPFEKASPVCIGCGACADVCPTDAIHPEELCEKEIIPLVSEFDAGLGRRPVMHTLYPQAVPNAPAIDRDHCLFFNKEQCRICETVCEAEAVDYRMEPVERTVETGAVILSPGFDLFDAGLKGEYGYGIYPNVVTSRQFERILSASGPTSGDILRPSDGTHPKRIAFISCVGSRDSAAGHEYCSSVCCMYATKEAIIAKEHEPDIEAAVFYMDVRAFGKGFERYYQQAQSQYGIRYIPCIPSKIVELQQSKTLRLRYWTDDRELLSEEFDLVVLATGITPSPDSMDLARRLGVELNEYGFCRKPGFSPTETSVPGIFVSGVFGEPKDIPETVIEASSAAAEASMLLAPARGTLTAGKSYPEEKPFVDEEPRIGVFVCRCGRNIGAVVDVPSVVEYARTLPHVVYADENLYTCSQDSLEFIKSEIVKHDMTRVVVASCTPTTHAPLFRETIREVGLNPYLFDMASLREHVSWVHMNLPEKATEKAREVVAMAVSKASLLEPIRMAYFDLNKEGLVVGGGLAGMSAALSLAEQGFKVHLVEKQERLGGHLNELFATIDGKDPQRLLQETVAAVEENDGIRVYTGAEIQEMSGYLGNFSSRLLLKNGGGVEEIEHGIVIVATGAREHKPEEYLYGRHPRVVTQSEMERRLAEGTPPDLNRVVMIQCVGSRDDTHPYCSRICCTQAVKNALKIKQLSPDCEVVVLYRDIRTYGFREKYYLEARRKGIIFVRYDENDKPRVSEVEGVLKLESADFEVGGVMSIRPDWLVLSTGIHADNEELSRTLKLPLTEDGFFMEAHAKIRPLDFTADGMFLAGMAHSPRTLEESMAQARGAAVRAATVLSKDKIQAKAEIPMVKDKWCSGCLSCEKVCPYDARKLNPETRVAEVIEVLCQACGACSVACPSGVSEQKGFEKKEIFAMIEAGLES